MATALKQSTECTFFSRPFVNDWLPWSWMLRTIWTAHFLSSDNRPDISLSLIVKYDSTLKVDRFDCEQTLWIIDLNTSRGWSKNWQAIMQDISILSLNIYDHKVCYDLQHYTVLEKSQTVNRDTVSLLTWPSQMINVPILHRKQIPSRSAVTWQFKTRAEEWREIYCSWRSEIYCSSQQCTNDAVFSSNDNRRVAQQIWVKNRSNFHSNIINIYFVLDWIIRVRKIILEK